MTIDGTKNAEEHGSRLPPNIAKALYGGGSWSLPGDDTEECEGSIHHSPTPLFTHWTPLVPRDWYDGHPLPSPPHADLCGTCRDNLSLLLQMLHASDGQLGWETRREFGNGIRALATRGWAWFTEHRPAESSAPPAKG